MSFFDSMAISSSALSAQRTRMELISSNLANVNTTRTPEGGPYQRKDVIFKSITPTFDNILQNEIDAKTPGVNIDKIYNDPKPFILKFEPHHPDADNNGYVTYPNINVIEEMVNMIATTRSFEANITAIEATKSMAASALQIGV